MSHQTYFGTIPRDINEMTLYYLPPEKLRSTCESNDEFQRICQDPRFLESYAKEKLLLSPQVGQTHFLPRAERFQLLGEIGYEPLISFILEHEDDIEIDDIADIAKGAAKAGHEDVVNWALETIRKSGSLPRGASCEQILLHLLVRKALMGNHLNLAERLFNLPTTVCVNYSYVYDLIGQILGEKDLYDVFQQFLSNIPAKDKILFELNFIEGSLSRGNLRYFNESLSPQFLKTLEETRRYSLYVNHVVIGAVKSGDPEVVKYVLRELPTREIDNPEIIFYLARGNPSIWNLGKNQYDPSEAFDYADIMGSYNQAKTFNVMMSEFSPPFTRVFPSFIRGLAHDGHFQTMFTMLDQANWPKDVDYTEVMGLIIHRDDVESVIRLLRSLKEHGISLRSSTPLPQALATLAKSFDAKDILKWMTIHGMIPPNV